MSIRVMTERLRLEALTAQTSRAAISDRTRFAALLTADVPEAWPPVDLADVQQLLADKLDADPALCGWAAWYVILRGDAGQPDTLIGSAGVGAMIGPPGPDGVVTMGYGLLPEFEGRGFATEAARAIVDWAWSQPSVRLIRATTFERHHRSIRVLDKLGFRRGGVAPEDATAPESDRQGRGRLLEFFLDPRL